MTPAAGHAVTSWRFSRHLDHVRIHSWELGTELATAAGRGMLASRRGDRYTAIGLSPTLHRRTVVAVSPQRGCNSRAMLHISTADVPSASPSSLNDAKRSMSTTPTKFHNETRCLLQALIPMDDDDTPRWFAKLMALCLFAVWVVAIFDLGPTAVPQYLQYGMTALLFLIIGRLWDLEVQKYGIAGLLGGTDGRQGETRDDRDRD